MNQEFSAGPLADPDHPWIGLDYYTEELAGYFFGRTEETRELYQRIRSGSLTVLFGQSGLGKSSLLRAGLFPLLVRDGYRPIVIRLDYRHPDLSLIEQVRQELRRALPLLDGGLPSLFCYASATGMTLVMTLLAAATLRYQQRRVILYL